MGGGDDASGGGDTAASDAGTSSVPAKAAASAPAAMPAHEPPAVAEAVKPPSPMVEAYRKRRKIPMWAMPVLAALPVWAYVYVGTLDPPPAGEGPLVLGEEAYAGNGCGGCHGAGGGGGVGPAFSGGAIYETWPRFEDHFEWVRLGSAGWQAAHGDTYGANDKPVGQAACPASARTPSRRRPDLHRPPRTRGPRRREPERERQAAARAGGRAAVRAPRDDRSRRSWPRSTPRSHRTAVRANRWARPRPADPRRHTPPTRDR